jgi:hypothetical protein
MIPNFTNSSMENTCNQIIWKTNFMKLKILIIEIIQKYRNLSLV